MSEYKTKTELLDAMTSTHQDMMRLLAAMGEQELSAPTLDGGWSPKDALAHIVAWEKMAMDWLTRSVQGEHVKRFVPGFLYDTEAEREPTMEKLNTFLFERDKTRTAADVLQDLRATHKAMYELVARTDERDIFDPQRFAWRNGSPALDMILANTVDHYREHGDAIWLAHKKSNMNFPADKQELLRRIRTRHADMEELIAELSPQEMVAPVLDDGWSVKDSLAHLAAWENNMLGWIGNYQRGEPVVRWAPGFEIDGDNSELQMNRYNAHLFAQSREHELTDVLDTFRETFMNVVATIESLSDAEIFDETFFPARDGSPLLDLIIGDTYGHYDEHRGWIHTWLEHKA